MVSEELMALDDTELEEYIDDLRETVVEMRQHGQINGAQELLCEAASLATALERRKEREV